MLWRRKAQSGRARPEPLDRARAPSAGPLERIRELEDELRRSNEELKALRRVQNTLAERWPPGDERLPGAEADVASEPLADDPYIGDRRLRLWFYSVAASFTPLVGVDGENGRFILPTRAMGSIGRQLVARGTYAGDMLPRVLQWAAEAGATVQRGGAIFDIGANIGTVAIPALGQYGYERGVAFEAHPVNAHLLRLNVAHNDLTDRLQVVEAALGAVDESILMRLEGKSGGHRVLGPAGASPPDQTGREDEFVEVRAAKLDTLIERGEVDPSSLTLVWIDVQGYEAAVLQGAATLLRDPPLIVTEFSPRHLASYRDLDAMTELIGEYFTHVIDVRDTAKSERLTLYPVGRMAELTEELGDKFTDLALLRIPSPSAAR